MREFDRDLIRGGHYGQRSYEPRQKAGHMAAPTNAAKREESPCQPGAVHTWHVTPPIQTHGGAHPLASCLIRMILGLWRTSNMLCEDADNGAPNSSVAIEIIRRNAF